MYICAVGYIAQVYQHLCAVHIGGERMVYLCAVHRAGERGRCLERVGSSRSSMHMQVGIHENTVSKATSNQ